MDYKVIIDSMPTAAFITENNKIIYLNKEAEKLLKIESEKQIIGISIKKYIFHGYYNLCLKWKENICSLKQKTIYVDLKIINEKGGELEVEAGISPIFIGKKDMQLCIVRDISKLKKDGKILKEINKQLSLYIKENENLMFQLRRFRHNTLNILHGLNGFIETKNWLGLENYFSEVQEQIKILKDNNPFSIEKMYNLAVRGLLSAKLVTAQKANIEMKVEIDNDIKIDGKVMKDSDLCEILGIYLDNAIEAAEKALNKKVSIYFFEDNECISIIIENTYKDKPSLLKKQSSHLVSDKERGLGLQLSENILEQYRNILHNTFIYRQAVVQELHILKVNQGRW
ncbi:sensor histidine kinase [Candidatus Clostridium stratigraminis]|uniref:Sensor histidine kinase n=1 Tax=Candidatus Clostridium stratigraminis TaxID=3381661 RepID=A0ABW8T030_9CLOT